MPLTDLYNTFKSLGLDDGEKSHWFISTPFFWVTGPDLVGLIARAKKQIKVQVGNKPLFANIIAVPLPSEASYDIKFYMPQVEGCTVVYQGEIKP